MLSKCIEGACGVGDWFGLDQVRGLPYSWAVFPEAESRSGWRQKAGGLCPEPEQKPESYLWKESEAGWESCVWPGAAVAQDESRGARQEVACFNVVQEQGMPAGPVV